MQLIVFPKLHTQDRLEALEELSKHKKKIMVIILFPNEVRIEQDKG